ncbi:class III extradiol ring-cleavage dioxygenase [Chromobacterium sp. IIBBL 290-4]|uniref:DODA-type extradiol aromatic ring-opening family dioxygenase n=1 Tax=Chromobacterium sp. IIBBL 290-4 TaxID=2953890 RepID=UPI0020B80249|nr:class III extradiol ring-cleavage dioxygenase [Chromobacterium sp. IIBBL 290-4]UTH72556.1 dioxygenase [Chromobacterium sp. IIBBL 290-4]
MSIRQAALFISHGAPTLPIEDSPTRRFLKQLGQDWPRPRAIIILSAHWETHAFTVNQQAHPGTLYDFGGFPPVLRTLLYPAATDQALAAQVSGLLASAGLRASTTAERPLDHGMWTPLLLMYPQADIPVVMISLRHRASAAEHYALGRALRPLRDENVLILGSGSYTHNLWNLSPEGSAPQPWATAFAGWMDQALLERRHGDIVNWLQLAPHARDNHPSDEHFNPLLAALGAADENAVPVKLHDDWRAGSLSMACWRFD